MEQYHCLSCHKVLEAAFMCQTSKKGTGLYKKCKSAREFTRQQTKKIMISPFNYMYCDDCDKSFFRWVSSRNCTGQKTNCPECDSTKIFSYADDYKVAT